MRIADKPSVTSRATQKAKHQAKHKAWRHGALQVLFVALALSAPLALTHWLGGEDAWQALATFPLTLLVAMFALAVACWNLNAWRLRLLLAGRAGALSQRSALGIELASKCALCATPGGSGGPAVLLTLLARRNLPPSKGAGIFLIDQAFDSLFFISLLSGLALYTLSVDTGWPYQRLIRWSLVALTLVIGLGIVCLWTFPRWRLGRRGTRLLSPRLGRTLVRHGLRCRQALLRTLGLPKRTLAMVALLTVLHWCARYSLLYLAVRGVGGHIDWLWTFFTQMLGMAASQFSFLPGGAGTAEIGVSALLVPFLTTAQIAAAVLIWRLFSYHLYLLVGAPVLLWFVVKQWRNRHTLDTVGIE